MADRQDNKDICESTTDEAQEIESTTLYTTPPTSSAPLETPVRPLPQSAVSMQPSPIPCDLRRRHDQTMRRSEHRRHGKSVAHMEPEEWPQWLEQASHADIDSMARSLTLQENSRPTYAQVTAAASTSTNTGASTRPRRRSILSESPKRERDLVPPATSSRSQVTNPNTSSVPPPPTRGSPPANAARAPT